MDTPSHRIMCLEFTDNPIMSTIVREGTCSWKYIVIANRFPWNNLPGVPSLKTLYLMIHCIVLFIPVLM